MNIEFQKHDDLNATVVIALDKSDYQESVEKELKSLQKRAAIKGFRPGKAPMGMINKMYGKNILADEIQRLATDTMNKYITDEKLDILGYPIASDKIESELDIDNSENFKFAFDLGLAPHFEFAVSKKDNLDLFEIEVGEKEVTDDINYSRRRNGKLEDVEKSEDEDIVYATVTELGDNGNILEGGIAEKQISFVPNLVENAKLKKAFIGKKVGDVVKANLKDLLNNNETVISSTLAIAKEGVADLSDNFQVEIKEIKRRTESELNEEYYRQLFGDDIPASEEEYRERIKNNLIQYYKNEADLWLDHQIGHLLLEKHPISLPDAFLKRWLITTKGEDYNFDNIEEKYEEEKSALQRRLVIDKIAADQKLEATADDIREEARIYFIGMYRQYGLTVGMMDQFLEETVAKRLQDREFVMQMSDRVIYRKAYDAVKEMVTIKTLKTDVDGYFKHINEHKAAHGE